MTAYIKPRISRVQRADLPRGWWCDGGAHRTVGFGTTPLEAYVDWFHRNFPNAPNLTTTAQFRAYYSRSC